MLGAGNLEPEFRALGMAFPPLRQRQAALLEALQPPPVQQPYVPVLVAGVGERTTLRGVAQYGDASNFTPSTVPSPAAIERKCDLLREHCASVGRACDSVLRIYQFVPVLLADTVGALAAKRDVVPPFLRAMDPLTRGGFIGTPEQAVERLLTLVGAGCQYFILSVLDVEALRLVAERVVPAVLATAPSSERANSQ